MASECGIEHRKGVTDLTPFHVVVVRDEKRIESSITRHRTIELGRLGKERNRLASLHFGADSLSSCNKTVGTVLVFLNRQFQIM
jgi:hypothetical protein